MILLCLDTCDLRGSVCVCRDGLSWAATVHDSEEDYSSWLLPAIQRALGGADLALDEVEAFAVAGGPGSFTGLRVGLTTVKGLAEVYGRPIASVSRLEAIATLSSVEAEWIAAIVEAGRGEIYAALYRREESDLALQGEECVLPAAEFLEFIERAVPIGSVAWVSPYCEGILREARWTKRRDKGDTLEVVTPVLAPVIGRIGYARVRAGKGVGALALEANYIRRSDAERFWKDGGCTAGYAR